jgi:hypothetical protein
MHNQSPARQHRPPGSANGLASRSADSPQSKPLLAALRPAAAVSEPPGGLRWRSGLAALSRRRSGSGALREALSDPLSGPAIVGYLAVLTLLVHFYFNAFSNYGLFFDELYFVDVGKHLDWGYVDNGPLTMWMVRLSHELMGDSIFALRFFAAIAGALTIGIAGLMARELGGGRFAQGLAALAVLIAPVYLGAQNMMRVEAMEPVWWELCAYLLIRIIKTGNTRLWVWFGVIVGLGFLNKPSMLFLGAAVTVSLLLTPERKYLFNRWALLGGLAALLIVLPNILWQISHDWATVQYVAQAKRRATANVPSWLFLVGQVLFLHPLNLPIWLGGLGWFLVAKAARSFRVLGWAYLLILGFLLVVKSQIHYFTPVYPFLLAGGAVAIERWVTQRGLRRLKWALPAVLVAGGLVVAPMMLPVLPIEKTDAYVTAVTAGLLKNTYGVTFPFHGAQGWQNLTKVVAEIFHHLSPEEQADCIIFASNYGEAGAIDYYGPALGLPPATAFHLNYYFWGPPAKSGNVSIYVGLDRDRLERNFGEVQQVATVEAPDHVFFVEDHVPVCICRKPRFDLKEAWPKFRERAFLNY